mgnify:CR=1 FL=1
MNVLCTICARGGSKGLKNKNILLFKKMPLISHTIKIAKKSKVFSKIVISSDSQKILNISKKENPNLLIKRPYNLSNSRVLKVLAIRHALKVSETNFFRLSISFFLTSITSLINTSWDAFTFFPFTVTYPLLQAIVALLLEPKYLTFHMYKSILNFIN